MKSYFLVFWVHLDKNLNLKCYFRNAIPKKNLSALLLEKNLKEECSRTRALRKISPFEYKGMFRDSL